MARFKERLVGLVSWRQTHLRSYEQAILARLESAILPPTRNTVQEQLKNLSLVQRHILDKEVNLYFNDKRLGHELLFPMPFAEWPIAVASCHVGESTSYLRATIWIAAGKVFSIIFSDAPPTDDKSAFYVSSVEVILDPSDTTVAYPSSRAVTEQEGRRVRDLIGAQIENAAIAPPLIPALRKRFEILNERFLPEDYRELLNATNGVVTNGWQISGVPLREVAMEHANLFVLAESNGPLMLCAMDGDTQRNVYLYNLEEFTHTCLGDRFIAAMQSQAG